MTDSRTLGERVPKEGLFLRDGIEGLRSLPKHSVDMQMCIRDRHGSAISETDNRNTASVAKTARFL